MFAAFQEEIAVELKAQPRRRVLARTAPMLMSPDLVGITNIAKCYYEKCLFCRVL